MDNLLVVLGPPRSFTSVVSAMLGQHPEMFGLPEVHLFVTDTLGELLYFYKIAGARRQDGLLRAIAELFLQKQTVQTVQLAKQWLIKNRDMRTSEVFERLLAKIAPRIAVEKSVSTIWRPAHLQRLRDAFPKTRFLHLTRHPRAQCESMLEVAKNEPNIARQMMDHSTTPATLDPQFLWLSLHSNIVNFLRTIPEERYLRVHGEDILVEPDMHLRSICEWLGLRVDDAAIDQMKHPEQSPFSVLGPPNAPFGNDPKFIKEPALRPAKVKAQSLDGPLSWRNDTSGFSEEVKTLSREFGYD